MGESNKIFILTDDKDFKKITLGRVDFTKYLLSYSIESTQDAKDITVKFRLPNDEIKVQVDL